MRWVTCLAWAYFGWVDKDQPRALMEVCYFIAALVGMYNWMGQG